jgi:uncharacterized protein (UPF0333 family)
MKNLHKGFISPLLLAIIAVLFIGGGAYVYMQNKQANQPTAMTLTTQASSTTQATASQAVKNYSIPLCGLKLTVKNSQLFNVATGTQRDELGDDYGDYILINTVGTVENTHSYLFECQRTNIFQGFNIRGALSVDNGPDAAVVVSKNDYLVFDESTRSSIPALYSEFPEPHHDGYELFGFSNNDWFYSFSFSNPEYAKSQDNFIISVINPTTN